MSRRILWTLIATCFFSIAQADPITFKVTAGDANSIRFESKAPLETVTGETHKVNGTITLDPLNLAGGISAEIIVDAASLKTGNKTRDKHMRENHLNTDEYPTIVFRIQDASFEGALEPNSHRNFNTPGEFTLHGVTRRITVPAEVTYIISESGQRLHIVANFQVALQDYNIPRPKFLVMKLDEIQKIRIELWGIAP